MAYALKDRLNGATYTTNASNAEWYQVVLDHIPEIRNAADVINITPDEANTFKHDLARLFRNKKIRLQYLWITYLINEFSNDIEFTNITTIMVPNQTHMEKLFGEYLATARDRTN